MRKPAEPPREINLLFVCLGNSCRSQMAEALTRRLGEGKVRAWSAGSRPLGYILPETAEILAEKEISIDGQWSKGLKDVPVGVAIWVKSTQPTAEQRSTRCIKSCWTGHAVRWT